MSLARRVIKNSFFLSLTTVSDRLAEFVLFFLLARSLGPAFVGDYKTIVMFLTIFQNLANYGLMQLVMREVATCADREQVAALLMNYGVAGLLISIALLLVMNGVVAVAGYPAHVTLGVYVVSLALVPSSWRRVAEATISGLESMEYISLVSFLGALFRVLLTFLLLWRGGGMMAVLWVLVLTQFAVVPAYLYVIKRFLTVGAMRPDMACVRRMAQEVGLFLLMGILVIGVGTQIDILMVRRMTTAAEAGFYTAASTLVQLVFLLRPALLNSVFPNMATMFTESVPRLQTLTSNLLSLFVIVLLPVPFLVWILAEPLMPLLLGEGFSASAPVLQALIWIVLPSFAYAMLSRVLIAGQQERLNIQVAGVGMALNVILNLLLIPSYGAVGAALSSVLVMVLALAATYAMIHRRLFPLNSWQIWGKPLLAALAVGALAYGLRGWSLWATLPMLALLYVGVLWWLKAFPPSWVAELQSGWRKRKDEASL